VYRFDRFECDFIELGYRLDALDIDHVGLLYAGDKAHFGESLVEWLLSTLETSFSLVAGAGLLAFVSTASRFTGTGTLSSAYSFSVFRRTGSRLKIV
jgi:hypothetical protein